MLDLHVHLLGHLDREVTRGNIRLFLDEAKKKNLVQIGFADHDMYWNDLNLDLIREVAEEYPELQVRIGLEVDYREENEELIRKRISSYPFDYTIGSVHEISGWFFDYPEEEEEHLRRDPDSLYLEYFALVEKAAASGMFQIIGHFDLIKLFKIRPRTDVRILAGRTLETIRKQGLAIEVNTNGRYKPVQEFYPEPKLLELIYQMGIPITLGSDAHEPSTVGRDLEEVVQQLKLFGVKEITGFAGQRPHALMFKNTLIGE
ncbi:MULTISPECIES: histidinol-phosphatase HisJ family protein [Dehalobacter]|jgi:histidinol-phosphatase (PHP family)|uniref:Histidinol-phosphatase n=2 Tax=Dehalobacter restrictus TaxID=55583 RepID=A0A857DLE1_9FIRM|nr:MULTISPECIES: histidinol-phosphatase HisJ family protein [Dehalobacter]AHF10581.1 HisJ family histidinol phosphate phosphatase [Dehalobacter restrictus DSM 9455]MDJ0305966.1 histidinol-phosphatase HisJ family protein [Dehalobacter sp.]OCZ52381.1 histidinol phosphate phosphatase [Dehalobacter sp. TeCB1]QHA01205.1 histidinol-phosphatase HisJ family protein [Dehalobacter restrictus]